ncbi:DUF1700 domain-containing protein, partial [Staphylococcus aureus]|nr:DUF1700 domain-containing protein [Staphylococcus aureus]
SLKTLYRKRTVIWPFYFYTIIRTLSFFAISYSGLGLVFIIVIFKILEYIYRLILKYLLWYIKTVKGSVRK